jgi:hypothetical protein
VHNDERGRTEILDLGIRRSPTLVNSRYIFIDIAMAQIRDDPRPLPHTARSVSSHKGSTFESNIGLDISNATTNSRSPRSGSHHDVSSSAPQPSPGRPYELAKVVSVDELLAMTPHEYAEPPSLTNSSSLLTVMSEPMSRTSTDDIIYRPFEMFRMDPPIYPLRSAICPPIRDGSQREPSASNAHESFDAMSADDYPFEPSMVVLNHYMYECLERKNTSNVCEVVRADGRYDTWEAAILDEPSSSDSSSRPSTMPKPSLVGPAFDSIGAGDFKEGSKDHDSTKMRHSSQGYPKIMRTR